MALFWIIFVSLCMTNYELKAMKSNPAIYVEGVGWRRARVASLLRRLKRGMTIKDGVSI